MAIENDRQLEITRTWIRKFKARLEHLQSGDVDYRGHPDMLRAHRDAIASQIEDLEKQVEEYKETKV